MSTKNTVRQIVYMFLPAVLFMTIRNYFGILPAMALSLSVSAVMSWKYYKNHGRLNNSLIIGLCAALFSFFAYFFTNNERYYFIPAIIENLILMLLILFCIVRKKCYVYLFIKDFQIAYLDKMNERDFLSINYLWLGIFAVRFGMRFVSLFLLDLSFTQLYWISFLAGDPIMIPVFAYTYYYFRKKMDDHYLANQKAVSLEKLEGPSC